MATSPITTWLNPMTLASASAWRRSLLRNRIAVSIGSILPVPINRSDDAYFAPLRDLPSGDAKVFLGLIHLEDGVQGSLGASPCGAASS